MRLPAFNPGNQSARYENNPRRGLFLAMNDSSYILWWILCAIIGGAIGHMKEQAAIGVILGALLGPIGVIISLFLSDPKVQRARDQQQQRMRELLWEQRKRTLESREEKRINRAIPKVLSAAPQAHVVPPPPGAKVLQSYRIASNGEELGVVPLATIQQMLHAGRLLETDHYFDAPANEWRTLDQLKDVV